MQILKKIFFISLINIALAANGQVVYIKTADQSFFIKALLLNKNKALVGTISKPVFTLDSAFFAKNVQYITMKGYDTLSIEPKLFKKDTFLMVFSPISHIINTVIISGNKGKQSFQDITSSIVKIEPRLITERNNTSLSEAINQIPAVNVVDNQASIRGGSGWSYGSGSRVMVTVDGLPAISGDANQIQWQFLDLENIQNLEVLKGPSSVLYGSSALNGAINIQTKEATDTPSASINTFFGIYGKPASDSLKWTNNNLYKYGLNALFSFKNGKTSYVFTTNNIVDNGYRMGDESNRTRLGIKINKVINKKIDFGLNVAGMYSKGSTFLLWESEGYGFTALDSNFTVNKTSRLAIDPTLNINGKFIKHQFLGRLFLLDNNIFQEDTLSNQSNASDFSYLEYRGHIENLFAQIKATFGATANFSNTNSPIFLGKQSARNYASYLQLERRLKKWYLSTGIRYEYFQLNNRAEGRPVVKAGITYTPRKYSIFRASYGEGFRFPSIAESYVQTNVGAVAIYPNDDLKSENAWNAELGVKQGFGKGIFKGYLDLAFFYTEIKDMLEFTFASWGADRSFQNGFGLGFKTLNVSNSVINGLDFNILGTLQLKKHKINILAGYVLSNARSTDPNLVIATDSFNRPLTFNSLSSDTQGSFLKYRSLHTIKADIQWNYGTWSIGWSGRYNSFIGNIDNAFVSFPINLAVPGVAAFRAQNNQGNFIMDIRVIKKMRNNYAIGLIINNIANKIVMERPTDLRPPRYMMLQIKKQF